MIQNNGGPVTTSGLTMSTARLLGRSTASTGAVEEVTVGTGLSLSAGTLTATGGGGGTPAGSSGDLQYNNAGAFGATTGVTFPGTGRLAMAQGTITTALSPLAITETRNAAGVTFPGLSYTVTNTASAAASALLSLAEGSTARVTVLSNGQTTIASGLLPVLTLRNSAAQGQVSLRFEDSYNGAWHLGTQITYYAGGGGWHGAMDWVLNSGSNGGTTATYMSLNALRNTLSVGSGVSIGWSSTTAGNGTVDTAMSRNATGVVEVNNGTAGAFRDLRVRRLRTEPTTVAGLPTASSAGAGAQAFVTDANATTFASVVAGGGSNGVPVYSDGTDWRIG